jgi:hypothetical protein
MNGNGDAHRDEQCCFCHRSMNGEWPTCPNCKTTHPAQFKRHRRTEPVQMEPQDIVEKRRQRLKQLEDTY